MGWSLVRVGLVWVEGLRSFCCIYPTFMNIYYDRVGVGGVVLVGLR